MNLGEVYISLNELDKAEYHYHEILKLNSESVKDRETINNFSQACFCLARIAILRKNSDEAVRYLKRRWNARRNSTETSGGQQTVELNFQTMNILQVLASQRFQRGEYREGEACLWPVLARLSEPQRRGLAEQLGGQCRDCGQTQGSVAGMELHGLGLCDQSRPAHA